jgi:hypothetical protein
VVGLIVKGEIMSDTETKRDALPASTRETKTWLYDVQTFRGGNRLFPFVLQLSIEELAQLHALLQLHADDLSNNH